MIGEPRSRNILTSNHYISFFFVFSKTYSKKLLFFHLQSIFFLQLIIDNFDFEYWQEVYLIHLQLVLQVLFFLKINLFIHHFISKKKRKKNLVGSITIAPICFFFNGISLLFIISMIGIKNAKVFPEPVTASTTTSLFWRKSGIVAAWTGVIWVNSRDSSVSSLRRKD